MTHQNLHLEKCWKLFLATLNSGSIINRAAVGVRGLCFTFGFLTAQP